MIVVFISECSGKSIKKTRSILDKYANRIGTNAWKTYITQEGLHTVKSLLAESATKSTSVVCHKVVRGRMVKEWIVGNRNSFDEQGNTAISSISLKKQHKTHVAIKFLASIAGMWHDVGKGTIGFQDGTLGVNRLNKQKELSKQTKKNTVNPDNFRHEYISLLVFASLVKEKPDKEWMSPECISNIGSISTESLNVFGNPEEFISGLPPVASMVAWIIASHHMIPGTTRYSNNNIIGSGAEVHNIHDVLSGIQPTHYFRNSELRNSKEIKINEELKNVKFKGNPFSKTWINRMITLLSSDDAKEAIKFLTKNNNNSYILRMARLSMMLGDYKFSSGGKSDENPDKNALYANTRKIPETDKVTLNQRLDTHLLGVSSNAMRFARQLSNAHHYNRVYDNNHIASRSPDQYQWQDNVVEVIKSHEITHGCFVVNTASTGTGKTIGNAKIMHALSGDDSMRYTMALGLRSLTRQTGDVYRNQLGMAEHEVSTLIGGRFEGQDKGGDKTGSESGTYQRDMIYNSHGGLIDESVKQTYSDLIPEHALRMISTPVLCCTIDHVMPVTENTIGGKYIAPLLRLLSADLVIDEVDDYEFEDLMCIARLIHLAGVCGRNVVISSATITPGIVKAFHQVYETGWQSYAAVYDKYNKYTSVIVCDEFNAIGLRETSHHKMFKEYEAFANQRVKNIESQPVTRLADVVPVRDSNSRQSYYESIMHGIKKKHNDNHDKIEGKNISIGLVFVRRVSDCVRITKYLDQCDTGGDYNIHVMPYHASQTLELREKKEKYIDSVLSGKTERYQDHVMQKHIHDSNSKNIIFILVATSVETIGRDHDFDWGILEPSSCRSIIQAAGRVNRHRNKKVKYPNIGIMQYNLSEIDSKNPDDNVFCKPGYETNGFHLDTHNIVDLLPFKRGHLVINSNLRIVHNSDTQTLPGIEHANINRLHSITDSVGSLLKYCLAYWMTGGPNVKYEFRRSQRSIDVRFEYHDDVLYYRVRTTNNKGWCEKVAFNNSSDDKIQREWLSFEPNDKMNMSIADYKINPDPCDEKHKFSTVFGMHKE